MIAYGDLIPLDEKNPSVFAYEREYQDEKMLVICNFYGKETVWDSEKELEEYQCILSNYEEHSIKGSRIELKPYEAVVLYKK